MELSCRVLPSTYGFLEMASPDQNKHHAVFLEWITEILSTVSHPSLCFGVQNVLI